MEQEEAVMEKQETIERRAPAAGGERRAAAGGGTEAVFTTQEMFLWLREDIKSLRDEGNRRHMEYMERLQNLEKRAMEITERLQRMQTQIWVVGGIAVAGLVISGDPDNPALQWLFSLLGAR